MKISFIGYGNMANCILKGILTTNKISPLDISVSNRTEEKLFLAKKELGVNITSSNLDCAKFGDIIIICTKPNQYKSVLDEIAPAITNSKVLVSIAAGLSINSIEAFIKKDVKLIRCMPNTPALVSQGITALCKNKNVSDSEFNFVKDIFDTLGKTEVLDESLFHAFIGIAGSSPAYVYMFIEALADGAVLEGMSRESAIRIASQAVLGSAKMVLETSKHPAQLKDSVCSPGGTTIEAVYSLEKNNFRGTVIEAVRCCSNKDKEFFK